MGSGASSNEKRIVHPSGNGLAENNKKGSIRTDISEIETLRCQLKNLEEQRENAEQRATNLEKQLTEVETHNLDLQEKLQIVESRLQYLENSQPITENNGCEETLKAKDKYIEKLEKETKEIESQMNKLKMKFKKKLKAAQMKATESKSDTSLKMFELQEEIHKLRTGLTPVNEEEDNSGRSSSDGNKQKIILELSNKVSEQESMIRKLESQLKSDDTHDKRLKMKMPNDRKYKNETIDGNYKSNRFSHRTNLSSSTVPESGKLDSRSAIKSLYGSKSEHNEIKTTPNGDLDFIRQESTMLVDNLMSTALASLTDVNPNENNNNTKNSDDDLPNGEPKRVVNIRQISAPKKKAKHASAFGTYDLSSMDGLTRSGQRNMADIST